MSIIAAGSAGPALLDGLVLSSTFLFAIACAVHMEGAYILAISLIPSTSSCLSRSFAYENHKQSCILEKIIFIDSLLLRPRLCHDNAQFIVANTTKSSRSPLPSVKILDWSTSIHASFP